MHPVTRVSTDPFWVVAAIWLSPLAVLPWTSVPAMSSVTPFALLACAVGHLGSIIVSWRLGRGSASRTFARMLTFLPFAVVGNTALAFFIVANSYASMAAQGLDQGCGMAALLILFAPIYTVGWQIAAAFVLALFAWLRERALEWMHP